MVYTIVTEDHMQVVLSIHIVLLIFLSNQIHKMPVGHSGRLTRQIIA